jgi:hypothetical protein
VTDASTKGLFPQLTEVLHALTNSHVLLLNTIQTVRLEHISAVYPVVGSFGEGSDAQIHEYVDYESEINALPSQAALPEFGRDSRLSVAGTEVADQTVTSPSSASAEIVTPQGEVVAPVSERTPLFSDATECQRVDPTDAESENRNYNFFDELDARLAGLGETESAENR